MNNIVETYVNLSPQVKSAIFILLIIIIFSVLVGRKAKKADPLETPKGILFLGVTIVDGINKFTESVIGTRWRKFSAFILAIILFLSLSMMVGFFGLLNPLTDPYMPLILAIAVFIVIQLAGITYNGFFKHFWETLADPHWVFIPLNIIGELAKPLSMGMRIFGNILSGVIIMALFYGVTEQVGTWLTLIVAPLGHLVFDVFFAAIQVLVFALLSVVFISLTLPEEETKIENEELNV